MAIDIERKLRALASASRHKAFKVAVNDHVADLLIGSGATRLTEIEAHAKRRFVLEPREGVPHDFFEVLDQGTLEKLQGETPVAEGSEVQVKLVEVGKHDLRAGVGSRDGYTVSVGDAAGMIGKTVRARIERFVEGTAYATLVSKAKPEAEPITAEGQAEKPTRKPPAKRTTEPARADEKPEAEDVETPAEEPVAEEEVTATADAAEEEPKPKKKTRRGSRGGRGRKKKPPTEAAAAPEDDGVAPAPKIHVPEPSLGEETAEPVETEPVSVNGDPQAEDGEAPKPRKKTRRGSRGGRNRRKKPVAASANGGEERGVRAEEPELEPAPAPASDEYVPMSEWIDEVDGR
jgi:predicted RNA-binding protein with TRAM domain